MTKSKKETTEEPTDAQNAGPENTTEEVTTDTKPEQPVGDATSIETPKKEGKLSSFLNKTKSYVKENKKKILLITIPLLALLIAIAAIKPLRYTVLNLFISETVNIAIIDSNNSTPLPEAVVLFDSTQVGISDENGIVILENVPLGSVNITIEKEAYKSSSFDYEVKLGDNNIDSVDLEPTGIPVTVSVSDAISKQAVTDAEVSIIDGSTKATANDSGEAEINVPPYIGESVKLNISAPGYNETSIQFTLEENMKPIKVELVREGKHYYLSNKTGEINVYSSNLDGSDEQVLITGTGLEQEYGTQLVVSPARTHAMLIATRDNIQDNNGNRQPALYLINFEAKTIERIDEGASSFSSVGWVDNMFVYVISNIDSTVADNSKLKTANTDGTLNTVASSTFINQYGIVNEEVYFTKQNKDYTRNLFVIDPLNPSEKEIAKKVNSVFSDTPTELKYNVGDAWFMYSTNDGSSSDIGSTPSSQTNVAYLKNPSSGKYAYIDRRDGKGVVISKDASTGEDTIVSTGINATHNLNWLTDDLLIVRVSSTGETADYIVDTKTQTNQKITDVFNSSSRGYY